MPDNTIDLGESEPRDPEIVREAWLLATSRMSRLTGIVVRLKVRGRSNDRVAAMLHISNRRVHRHMVKAIIQLVRAFQELEERRP